MFSYGDHYAAGVAAGGSALPPIADWLCPLSVVAVSVRWACVGCCLCPCAGLAATKRERRLADPMAHNPLSVRRMAGRDELRAAAVPPLAAATAAEESVVLECDRAVLLLLRHHHYAGSAAAAAVAPDVGSNRGRCWRHAAKLSERNRQLAPRALESALQMQCLLLRLPLRASAVISSPREHWNAVAIAASVLRAETVLELGEWHAMAASRCRI